MIIAGTASVVFQGNHAKQLGGGITSNHHVTVTGSVQFINNSANHGSAIHSKGTACGYRCHE